MSKYVCLSVRKLQKPLLYFYRKILIDPILHILTNRNIISLTLPENLLF